MDSRLFDSRDAGRPYLCSLITFIVMILVVWSVLEPWKACYEGAIAQER